MLGAQGYLGRWHRCLGEAGETECERRAVAAATSDFTVRQPALATGKGTIRLRSEDAARIPDDELGDPVPAALKA